MKILIDLMGADREPAELLRGVILARKECQADLCVIGDEQVISDLVLREGLDISGITVANAPDVISMEDSALSVVREKRDSSMATGLRMLAEGEGDAFVSCGNTGALIAGATLLVRRIKGVERAGIATVLPFAKPCLLMDSGANLEVSPSNLEQFAYMGSKYMEKVLGVKDCRVGLLNNGTEPTKGGEILAETYQRLLSSGMNFVGNVEGKTVPLDACDVLVTDGFTGNVLLKYTEGMGKFMMQMLGDLFRTNAMTRMAAASMKGKLRNIKRQFDASEYGGAPLLGISKPVIKAHGSSDANAVRNAIRQAITFASSGVNREIAVYALDYETRVKERKRAMQEAERAKERAEKLARKQKEKETKTDDIQKDE